MKADALSDLGLITAGDGLLLAETERCANRWRSERMGLLGGQFASAEGEVVEILDIKVTRNVALRR